MEMRNGVLAWNGTFAISPAAGKDGKPEPRALPVMASGAFFATPNAVEVPEYRLEIGDRDDPYVITGTGMAQIREEIFFRVEADGRQIDVDRLPQGAGEGADRPAATLATRLAALRGVLDRIPVPQAAGEIDFELPAIVAGDTVIREVSALVRPDGDGWQVERLRTTLPGNTSFEASGRLSKGDAFGFAGQMLLASRLSPQALAFDDLELVLDGVSIRGSLRREAGEGGQPVLAAVLQGEEIDLEDLKALQALTGEDAGAGIAGYEIDLALKTALLKAAGMEARDVDMQLRIGKGSVSIDRLNAGDFHGARVESSGAIRDLLGQPSGNLALTVNAADGSGLVALARERLGENRFLAALGVDSTLTQYVDVTLSLDSRPEGDGAKAVITAGGYLGGARFEFRDEFEGRPAEWG
ncbi:MAG: hypothetical protein MUE79_09410, partial [Nitratireductor sp.]|nr:hypothetical protein [Nitratireductor sp.]